MKKYSLNGIYDGIAISPEQDKMGFEAQVPGCVHTDLQRNGVFKNLFYGRNAEECQWVENWDFEFSKVFEVSEVFGNEYIQFDGLDVFCDIFLNDILIGSADDMFIQYQFPTRNVLIVGENKLTVHFYSAVKKVEGKPETVGAFTLERVYIRRMQCTFGWDWLNRFVTCGIWKDVILCVPEIVQLDSVYVCTKAIDGFGAQIDVTIDFDMQESTGLVY